MDQTDPRLIKLVSSWFHAIYNCNNQLNTLLDGALSIVWSDSRLIIVLQQHNYSS